MGKVGDKKPIKDESITKKYLDSALGRLDKKFDDKFDYIDKKFDDKFDYIDKKFDDKFEYLDKKIDKVDNKLDKAIHYMNLKFDSIEEKLTKLDSIDKQLRSIAKTLDWLVGKYKKFDEEHTILSEHNTRANGKLDNHEERISILEQRAVTTG